MDKKMFFAGPTNVMAFIAHTLPSSKRGDLLIRRRQPYFFENFERRYFR